MKAILRVFAVALVMIGIVACGPSPEELYQQGVGYYYNKDYAKAVECLTKAAKKGNKDAERYLAMIMENNAPKPVETPAETPAETPVDTMVADTITAEVVADTVVETVIVRDTVVVEKPVAEQPAAEKPVVAEPKPKPAKVSGGFSVSASKKVYFSKGNLQYQASTKKWRFAENQWDALGQANSKISDKNSGWIDLFGWGTGTDPIKNSTNNKDYGTFADWGKNNISNGGGNKWRTLTKDEWEYVFETRSTPSGVRFAKATVNGIKGIILLPDNWNISYYGLENANKIGANFEDNAISKSDWTSKLESKGAVFLPNAGCRKGTEISGLGKDGYYWSTTNFDSSGAYAVYIYDRNVNSGKHYYHKNGFAVRLVRNAN